MRRGDDGVERRAIEEAIERLLGGTPVNTDGRLTVVNLAAEAGVKRHVVTSKHKDLQEMFLARRDQASARAALPDMTERVAALEAANRALRAERDDLRALVDRFARVIQLLETERDGLTDGSVTSLSGRRRLRESPP